MIVECSPGSWALFAGTVKQRWNISSGQGYDPQFGARPLKRAIQEHLLDPLAMKLLAGEFKQGDRIKVTSNGESLAFKAK